MNRGRIFADCKLSGRVRGAVPVARNPGRGIMRRPGSVAVLLVALCAWAGAAQAGRFKFPLFDDDLFLQTSTKIFAGVSFRVEEQSNDFIGKNHINPGVCGRRADGRTFYQDCQGLSTGQSFLAQHLTDSPGQFSDNFDQGDLNYDQGDITQSGLRLNQTFTFDYKGWKLFGRLLGYYDPVNNNFDEYNPSLITEDNFLQSGYASRPGDEILSPATLASALGQGNIGSQLLGGLPIGIPALGVRTDSTACPPNRNPGLECGLVYGPGASVRRSRDNSKTRDQIGLALKLLDLNLSGNIPLPGGKPLKVRIGRQEVIWGENTVEFFDSLNVLNAPNLNQFFRIGSDGFTNFYRPVNAISLGYQATQDLNISGWYALEFRPFQLPASGSFYAPVNIGTDNDGQDYVTAGFANTPQDESGKGILLDNPLTYLTNTSTRIPRRRDQDPHPHDDFGIKLDYFANWLNAGTDIAFYFANYTSRTPLVSVYSSDRSCAKDSRLTTDIVVDCADAPLFHSVTNPNDPQGATDSILSFDSLGVQFQYPDDVKLYGLSFNTNFGAVSLQGEVAYRPNDPLQVDIVDLVFAGLGPSLGGCSQPGSGCQGTVVSAGTQEDGSLGLYGSSDFTTEDGTNPYPDTIEVGVGALPGSARSFPNFIVPYRGGTVGQNAPNSYIRGWETFKTLSYDLGATYVSGPSGPIAHFIRAQQIIWLFEAGVRQVIGLPSLDRLALAVPGTYTSPTAGADGSGADGSRQACSTNQACQFGADGLRFNPHQAPLGLYPDEFSGGVGTVEVIKFGNITDSVTMRSQIILKYDVFGHSPGYLSNYVEGRVLFQPTLTFRYQGATTLNFRYQLWAGGGQANLFRDRDSATIYATYEF